MRGRFIRLVSMVGVAFAVCTPVFVTAQIRKEREEGGEATTEIRVEKKAAPARPPEDLQIETEIRLKKKAAPARPPGDLQVQVEKMVKTVIQEIRPAAKVQDIAVPANVNVNMNVNVNAVAQQWRMRFRPVLQVEYMFVRLVCNPTKEQRLPIARAGLKALDEAAKRYVDWQNNQNRVVGGRLVERPAIPDTRRFIQEALAAAVKAHLSSGQIEWYRAEVEARSAEQKRVALVNLLAKLDDVLILSPEQREKIKESLASHWNEPWAPGLESFNYDAQYLPMVPDALVSTHLNDEQRTVWAGTQKVTFNSTGLGIGMTMNNEPLDDAFSDQEALKDDSKPEREPEAKP